MVPVWIRRRCRGLTICHALAVLSVCFVIGGNLLVSHIESRIQRLRMLVRDTMKGDLEDQMRDDLSDFRLVTNLKGGLVSRKQAKIEDDYQNEVPKPRDIHRYLNLTFTGTYRPPRSNLLKSYFDILNASLGQTSIDYQEPQFTPYDKRRRHAQHMCNLIPGSNKGVSSTLPHLWYLKDTRMIYCSVAKVGSSFWRRTWKAITVHDDNFRSPYQFSYEDFSHSKHLISRFKNESVLTSILDTSLKFLYTRDPYTRIFSAYVDKMLAPNTYLWNLGKKIVGQFRKGASKKSIRCGHDVTFGEFVKSIISTPTQSLDDHFIPVSEVCDVCSLQYDVIAKMETFKDDSLYLLNKVGILGENIKFKQFGIEYSVDSVIDLVTRTFGHRKRLETCMSFHVALRRLWRQFQVSGTINKEKPFPLTPEQSETVTEVGMINLALEAYKQTTKKSKLNKKEALLSGYQQVPLSDLERLREKYSKDLMLFDYDERPKEIFDKSNQPLIPFDYFDVLRE